MAVLSVGATTLRRLGRRATASLYGPIAPSTRTPSSSSTSTRPSRHPQYFCSRRTFAGYAQLPLTHGHVAPHQNSASDADVIALQGLQEGVLLERLPLYIAESDIQAVLNGENVVDVFRAARNDTMRRSLRCKRKRGASCLSLVRNQALTQALNLSRSKTLISHTREIIPFICSAPALDCPQVEHAC